MHKQKGQTQTQIQTHTQMSHTTEFWGNILSLLPALVTGELDDMGEFVDIGDDLGDIDTDDTGNDGDESEFALKRAGRAGFISADRQTDRQIDKEIEIERLSEGEGGAKGERESVCVGEREIEIRERESERRESFLPAYLYLSYLSWKHCAPNVEEKQHRNLDILKINQQERARHSKYQLRTCDTKNSQMNHILAVINDLLFSSAYRYLSWKICALCVETTQIYYYVVKQRHCS